MDVFSLLFIFSKYLGHAVFDHQMAVRFLKVTKGQFPKDRWGFFSEYVEIYIILRM